MADRLVVAPRAVKLPAGAVRAEWLGTPGSKDERGWLSVGLPGRFEAELAYEELLGEASATTANFAYHLNPPISDSLPGISFGVSDLFNRSAEGRWGYLAITFRTDNFGALQQNSPTEISFGLSTRRHAVPFVGVLLPFTDQVRLLAEHDGYELRAGFEVRPMPEISLRWLFEGDQHMLGLRAQLRL